MESVEVSSLDHNGETEEKKKIPLKSILLLAAGAIILAVTITFVLASNNPKTQYFLAEKTSFNELKSVFEDRFSGELDWTDISKENPTSHDVGLSFQVIQDDWGIFPVEFTNIANSSSVNIGAVTDPKERKAQIDLGVNVLGFSFDDLQTFISTEEFILKLPFINDYIMLKDKDYGKMMEALNGYADRETLGLDGFMDEQLFEMIDAEKIEKEYVKYLYDEIPKDAFTKSKETVSVFGEDTKTTKLQFKLSEEEINDITVKLIEKIRDDEDIKVLLKQYYHANNYAIFMYGSEEAFIEEFENDLNASIAEIKQSTTKVDVTSTIWTKGKKIVKREFDIASEDDVRLVIEGDQLLDKGEQKLDYTITLEDTIYAESFDITAHFNNDKGKISDDIQFIVEGETLLQYEAEEDKNKDAHTFERTLTFDDGYWYKLVFGWDGETSYSKDTMKGSHEFSFDDTEGFKVALLVDLDGEVVKGVDFPSDDEHTIVDLGALDEEELFEYIYNDLTPQLEQWLGDIGGDVFDSLFNPYYY